MAAHTHFLASVTNCFHEKGSLCQVFLASPLVLALEIKTKTMLPFVLFVDDIVVRYMLRSDQVRCCNLMDGLQTVDHALLGQSAVWTDS